MVLHYNLDGSIRVKLNMKGKITEMVFNSFKDYKNFLEIIS